MTWSSYLLTLAVIYVVYYVFMIVYDIMNNGKKSNKDEIIPLTFEDDTEVKDVDSFEEFNSVQQHEPVKERVKPLVETGVINDDPITINDRKEEPKAIPILDSDRETETVKPTGKVKVIADTLIAGGLEYKELINQAVKGAISRSSQIDFGEV